MKESLNSGGNKEKPEDKEKLRRFYQLKKEGVSTDYLNFSYVIVAYCNSILGIGSKTGRSEEYKRMKIYDLIKEYPSYTDYMTKQGSSSFLTAKGKEIVKRLDEITLEIKSLLVDDDPSQIDMLKLKNLLQETSDLIYGQK